jgi:hypothetical protein
MWRSERSFDMKTSIWHALVLALLMAPAQSAIAQNTIRIDIQNVYTVELNFGFGSATRTGTDSVGGTLTLQSDGTWKGVVDAQVNFEQEMKGLGVAVCPKDTVIVSQRLAVVATPVLVFNFTTSTPIFVRGLPDGGYLALDVKPVAQPSTPPGPCLDMHYHDPDNPNIIPLLPLNDGRWTNPPKAGYVIGMPKRGVLIYQDVTLACDRTQRSPACSEWIISVQRP